jgi:cholesterol transport system auxiliary component
MKWATHSGLPGSILAALLVLLMTSCTLLSPVHIETKKGILDQMPLTIPQQAEHTATLLVLPPDTAPVYNTTQMAYRMRPYQVSYFTQNEWGATPGQMMLPLLVKTLENTHYFSEVFTPPYSSHYTYALRTQIVELTQDFTTESPVVHLSLRVQLSSGATGEVIASKEIELREPMQEKAPYSGVVAANNATAKALQDVAAFVLDQALIFCSSNE